MDINSKSYIIIESREDFDPEWPILAFRDNSFTPIELKKGINILTVEEYPELKYGFESICDDPTNYITKIDLSHFDGLEMTSMKNMFRQLETDIEFGNLNTSKVTDVSGIFDYAFINCLKSSTNLKFKFDFNSVINWGEGVFGDIDEMGLIDLSSWVHESWFSNIRINIFGCSVILNGLHLESKKEAKIFDNPWTRDLDSLGTISLKGCDENTIKWIYEELQEIVEEIVEDNLKDYNDFNLKNHIILDPNIKIFRLHDSESSSPFPEFKLLVIKEEVINKEEHFTPPIGELQPFFSRIEYVEPKTIKPIILSEFIDKLSGVPSGARMVIAFPQNGELWFPDEAVTSLRKSSGNLELMSGYYEESNVITPSLINFSNISEQIKRKSNVITNTKRYGLHLVLDVFPFTYHVWNSNIFYDYVALILEEKVYRQ